MSKILSKVALGQRLPLVLSTDFDRRYSRSRSCLHTAWIWKDPMGSTYVESHDFPNEMRPGATFTHDGWTWQVVEVATKQFDAPGQPELTLR